MKKPFIAHPDLANFYLGKSSLFDVEDTEMSKNIGRRFKFKNPACVVEHEEGWYVVHLQKTYDGKNAYRATWPNDKHNFGRAVLEEEIIWL